MTEHEEAALVSCGEFGRFLHSCEIRHAKIESTLDRIMLKLDEIKTPTEIRILEVEKALWWQRFILLLVGILVSIHPIMIVFPAVAHVLKGP